MIDANIWTIHKPRGLPLSSRPRLITKIESKIQEHPIRVHKAESSHRPRPNPQKRNQWNHITNTRQRTKRPPSRGSGHPQTECFLLRDALPSIAFINYP